MGFILNVCSSRSSLACRSCGLPNGSFVFECVIRTPEGQKEKLLEYRSEPKDYFLSST